MDFSHFFLLGGCQVSIYFLLKKDATCDRQTAKYDFYIVLGGQGDLTQVSQSTELCQCPQPLIWGRKYSST